MLNLGQWDTGDPRSTTQAAWIWRVWWPTSAITKYASRLVALFNSSKTFAVPANYHMDASSPKRLSWGRIEWGLGARTHTSVSFLPFVVHSESPPSQLNSSILQYLCGMDEDVSPNLRTCLWVTQTIDSLIAGCERSISKLKLILTWPFNEPRKTK